MARVNLVIRSDVLTEGTSADATLVFQFRERMAEWLSSFGRVAVTAGLRDTSFSSIHDLSTFSIAFPPGDFALKWVEVMIALRTVEEVATQIWTNVAPGAPATVELVTADVDGTDFKRAAAAPLRAGVSDVLPGAMRPLLALILLLALVGIGWISKPNSNNGVSPTTTNISVQVSYAAMPERQTSDRGTATQRRNSRCYSSRGRCDQSHW